MKRMWKSAIVGAAAFMLLGTQVSFAADQLRTQSRTKSQTHLKDGSGTQTKHAYQKGNLNQVKTMSGTAKQSGR